jgi:lipoprotein-releasing system ATP-binding protein
MILKACALSKKYLAPQPLLVLSDINLSLGMGESIAICGRSGEGKTTLLHILGSLEAADSGSLEIEGKLCTGSTSAEIRRCSIGFVFQSFNLLEDFTALENVLMPAKILRRNVSRKDGLELLDSVGLADRADFPVKLLSGGEKQRVAIARALCNNPSLILADEPTGNLDEANAEAIGDLLLSLVKKGKKSLILATHDTHLASLCGKTYTLSGGRLLASPGVAG